MGSLGDSERNEFELWKIIIGKKINGEPSERKTLGRDLGVGNNAVEDGRTFRVLFELRNNSVQERRRREMDGTPC